jgi:hypothetical protein
MSMKLPHGAAAVREPDELSASIVTSGSATMVIALLGVIVVALAIYWLVRFRAKRKLGREDHTPDPLLGEK